jgi:hypothetical protein
MVVPVKVELYGANRDGDARRFTVASGTAITKGTVLQLTDPRTASAHSAEVQPIAGIAAMDKDGSDYSTSITAWTNGIFEMAVSGATITRGAPAVMHTTLNAIRQPTAAELGTLSGATVIGYAMEDGVLNETINVRVKL